MMKNPDQRKQELLLIAKRIFLEKGYYNTSVSEIVKQCGVAQGTFYYYFKTKEEIFDEVVKMIANEHVMKIIENLKASSDPKKKIICLFEQIESNMSINIHDNMYERLISFKPLHDDIVRITMEQVTPLLIDIVNEGNQNGVFHVKSVDFTVVAMIGCGVGAILSRHNMNFKAKDFKILFKDFLERLLDTKFEEIKV